MGGSLGKKKSKIIIVGLDNSGKSTMINMLKPKKVLIVSPNTLLVLPNRNSSHSRLQSGDIQQKQNRLHRVWHVRLKQVPQSLGTVLRGIRGKEVAYYKW